jgi:hypothetical protein
VLRKVLEETGHGEREGDALSDRIRLRDTKHATRSTMNIAVHLEIDGMTEFVENSLEVFRVGIGIYQHKMRLIGSIQVSWSWLVFENRTIVLIRGYSLNAH